ncbi:MAG TPA: response regulator [Verrucomicrobiales bacterium]|jgi:PAS domain S-box-containing protein|nr:response regulator [Verrucomicrobiales bacterium]
MPHRTPILLVDDDDKNLLVLESILDAPDYRIIKASNADQTLIALMQEDCAAIVMDVRMPDMSGIELAQLIKRRRKTQHIPILFLTAHHDDEENVMLGYDVGAVDYITKPVNPAILRSKVGVFADLFRKTADLARLNAAMEAEIQDRKKAEERFRLVVEAAPHSKVLTDQNGRITLVNTGTEILFGYSRDELLGKPLTILLPAELPSRVAVPNGPSVENRFELHGRRKDGSIIPLEVGFGRFQTSEGTFELASLVDITPRKEAESALRASNEELALKNEQLLRSADERAQRILAEAARAEAEAANIAKDRFLAMLSHELRTPLSPVLHAVALLDEEECSNEVRQLVEIIRRNVQLEARLIDDLLDLARIKSGKLQLHLEFADVHDLILRAAHICEPDILKQNIDLRLDLKATRLKMRVDPARILQIFWNLINNAIKYSSSGGFISVTTADDDRTGMVRIEIADSGIGIHADRIHKIFDAFEQVHDDQSVGLGLGLAISRVLAEMHGGRIGAKSPGTGKGSIFTIQLPAAAGEVESRPFDLPREEPATESLRILLTEDHYDTAANLTRLLQRRGHQVDVASSVAEARSLIGRKPFDVLLSDIGLPDGLGLDLMAPFREAADGRVVAGIALSGYGMPEDVRRSTEAGFTHHLTKPIEFARLHRELLAIAATLGSRADAASPAPATQ